MLHDPEDTPGAVSFSHPDALETSATFGAAGEYLLRLKASDGLGEGAALFLVRVLAHDEVPPTPPAVRLVSPAHGSSRLVGPPVLLWAEAEAAEGSHIASLRFYRNGSPLGAALTQAPWLLRQPEASSGTATYSVVATDNLGRSGTALATVTFLQPGGGGGGGGQPGQGSIKELELPAPEDGAFGFPEEFSVSSSGGDAVTEEQIFPEGGEDMSGRTYLVEVVVTSQEYPQYTAPESEHGDDYNDTVSWTITPSWGNTSLSGDRTVNDLHDRFERGNGEAVVGFYTVRFPDEGGTLTFEATVQNVGDGALDTTVEFRLLPVEVKVTDFATKSDAVPYAATTNATPPENSELCLKADKTNEKAKIEIELPSITDTTMLSKMKWKVVQKPADTLVSEGVFGGATPPSVELSLGSGSSVEDEILFEVQVGVDEASFTPAVKMNVRVVRDRLNWWFEPFTADVGWRTAKPEPRADTSDYPAHKANAYKRESLQSIYEFFKSTTAIGPSTPKANWVKPAITCFGEFHDALKTANGNNPLVDLNSLARLNMTAVTELPSFDAKYGALRSAMAKQTTFPADPNPTLRATQWPARVQWATAAATAIGDARMTRGLLMEIWTKEGSMAVNSEDHASNNNNITAFSVWPLGFSAAVSAPPASANDAKTIYIYDVAYICLGSDFLLKHSGGADNQPDLQDYPAALAHFKTQADATGGAGIGDRIVSNLTVAGSAGNYTISANAAFYEDMLTLMAKHFLSVWQTEGPDVTYMAYNMGIGQFNNLKASLGNTAYPERARLGITDWSIHYEIRTGEWTEPRKNAQWFHCGRVAFEAKYP